LPPPASLRRGKKKFIKKAGPRKAAEVLDSSYPTILKFAKNGNIFKDK
jgi:hypothetical protein